MKKFKLWLSKKCLNAIYGKNSVIESDTFYRVWYFNERNMLGYDYKNFKRMVDAVNFAYQFLLGTGYKKIWNADVRVEEVKTVCSKKKGGKDLGWCKTI